MEANEVNVWIPFLSAIAVTAFGVFSTWLNNKHNQKIESQRRDHERQLEAEKRNHERQLEAEKWQRAQELEEHNRQREAEASKRSAQDTANRNLAEAAIALINFFRSSSRDQSIGMQRGEFNDLLATAERTYLEAYSLADPRIEAQLNDIWSAIIASYPDKWPVAKQIPTDLPNNLHAAVSNFMRVSAGNMTGLQVITQEPVEISTEDIEDMPF